MSDSSCTAGRLSRAETPQRREPLTRSSSMRYDATESLVGAADAIHLGLFSHKVTEVMARTPSGIHISGIPAAARRAATSRAAAENNARSVSWVTHEK